MPTTILSDQNAPVRPPTSQSVAWDSRYNALHHRDYTASLAYLQTMFTNEEAKAYCQGPSTEEDLGSEVHPRTLMASTNAIIFPVVQTCSFRNRSYHFPRKRKAYDDRMAKKLSLSETHCDSLRRTTDTFINKCFSVILRDFGGKCDIQQISRCLRNIIENNSDDCFFPVALTLHFIDRLVERYLVETSASSDGQPGRLHNQSTGRLSDENSDRTLVPGDETAQEDSSNATVVSVSGNHFDDSLNAGWNGRFYPKVGDSGVGDVYDSTETPAFDFNAGTLSSQETSSLSNVSMLQVEDLGIEDFYFDDDEINLCDSINGQIVINCDSNLEILPYAQNDYNFHESTNISNKNKDSGLRGTAFNRDSSFKNRTLTTRVNKKSGTVTPRKASANCTDYSTSAMQREEATSPSITRLPNGGSETTTSAQIREKWCVLKRLSTVAHSTSSWLRPVQGNI